MNLLIYSNRGKDSETDTSKIKIKIKQIEKQKKCETINLQQKKSSFKKKV